LKSAPRFVMARFTRATDGRVRRLMLKATCGRAKRKVLLKDIAFHKSTIGGPHEAGHDVEAGTRLTGQQWNKSGHDKSECS
jgi:hypothetical protein